MRLATLTASRIGDVPAIGRPGRALNIEVAVGELPGVAAAGIDDEEVEFARECVAAAVPLVRQPPGELRGIGGTLDLALRPAAPVIGVHIDAGDGQQLSALWMPGHRHQAIGQAAELPGFATVAGHQVNLLEPALACGDEREPRAVG